jgi:hypothetical protein
MKNILKTISLVLILYLAAFYAMPVFAQNSIDINKIESPTPTQNIPEYIQNLYRTALIISGILAVVMIVAGSIYISVSGASPDKQSEGKDMITQAIWGLLLLFGSYLILQTINPELVKLKSPGQKTVMVNGVPTLQDPAIVTSLQGCAGVGTSTSLTAPQKDGSGKVVAVGPCTSGQLPVNPDTNECQCFQQLTSCNQNSVKACNARRKEVLSAALPSQKDTDKFFLRGVTDGVGAADCPEPHCIYYRQDKALDAGDTIWQAPFYIPSETPNLKDYVAPGASGWPAGAWYKNYLGGDQAKCIIYAYQIKDEEVKRVDLQPWIKMCSQ